MIAGASTSPRSQMSKPVPSVMDLAAPLHGCAVFTKLDLKRGSYQIRVWLSRVVQKRRLWAILCTNFWPPHCRSNLLEVKGTGSPDYICEQVVWLKRTWLAHRTLDFFYIPIRKIYFANFNDEQRIFNVQIIHYSKLILVINNIVYLWPWISKIFHENCIQISKFST